MTIAWFDPESARRKEASGTPTVAIFGAGVSGLSLAHELIERGFAVEVYESAIDPDEEYACWVGGLAANQTARIPADVEQVHPYLFDEDPGGEDSVDPDLRGVLIDAIAGLQESVTIRIQDRVQSFLTDRNNPANTASAIFLWASTDQTLVVTQPQPNQVFVAMGDPAKAPLVSIVLTGAVAGRPEESVRVRYESLRALGALRGVALAPVQARTPIQERLQFDHGNPDPTPSQWLGYLDYRNFSNSGKVTRIFRALQDAYLSYSRDFSARRVQVDAARTAEGLPPLYLSDRMARREEFLVELRGHTSSEGDLDANLGYSLEWAGLVKTELLARNAASAQPIPDLEKRILLIGMGSAEPLGNVRKASGRRRSNRVEVRIVERRIPGEHGYRFFPSFYRHLFDTMKRTPLLDENLEETGSTTFDRLTSTDTIDLALHGGKAPREIPVRAPRSLEELRKIIEIHLSKDYLQLRERDLLRFETKMLRFLTSCSKRRATYEKENWWKFLDGPDYSRRMQKLLRDTPQALVAMNATETDARTQGVIYSQLLLDLYPYSRGFGCGCDDRVNATLNGPTSTSWLSEWKRYLKRQGVRFRCGLLDRLEWQDGELYPHVTLSYGDGPELRVIVPRAPGKPEDSELPAASIQDLSLEISPPEPDATEVERVAQLVAALDRVGSAGVTLDDTHADRGVLTLKAQGGPGDRVVRVRSGSPPGVVEHLATLNGHPLRPLAPNPAAAPVLRDQLLEGLRILEGMRRQVQPGPALAFSGLGEDSIRLTQNPGFRIVSLVGGDGEYGVLLGGKRITVEGHGDDLHGVRERLLARIQAELGQAGVRPDIERNLTATDFFETGILFGRTRGDVRPIAVSVEPWQDRMLLGPDFRVDEASTNFIVRPDDIVSFSSNVRWLAVEGSIPDDVEIAPSVIGPALVDPAAGAQPDFFVLAVPFETASALIWAAYETLPHGSSIDGCFAQMMEYEKATRRRDPQTEQANPLTRDGSGRPLPVEWPLRDLSGIQFFFDKEVRVGLGHTFYRDAAWGLSSISQLAYWRERVSPRSAFLGQLSVDIGHWYGSSFRNGAYVPPAWRSARQFIAEETWAQIKEGLKADLAENIVPPAYYHLDEAIEFGGTLEWAFASCVEISLLSATEYALSLYIDDSLVHMISANPLTPGDVVNAIETQSTHVAAPTQADIALAPRTTGSTTVDLIVSRAAAGFTYHIRVGEKLTSVTALGAPTERSIRDRLVEAVNSDLAGALASPVDLNEPGGQTRFVVRMKLAKAELAVSALGAGVDASGRDVLDALLMDPPGEVRIRRSPMRGVRIQHGTTTPSGNATPFLINPAGIWNPHGQPAPQIPSIWMWRPGMNAVPGQNPPPLPGLEDDEIFYRPTLKRWFMVGNQMATYTRMSTMESANESARHAVIGMLYAVLNDSDTDAHGQPRQHDYAGGGRLLGDMPKIWNPERYEFDDAKALKRLDERLLDNGLPHFMDILRIDDWLDGLPEELVPKDQPKQLGALIAKSIEQLESDWEFTPIDKIVESLRRVLKGDIDPKP
jgi:hypothetical protein